MGGITNKPYIEGVTPQEDKNGEQIIVIAQSVYVSGSMLYKGQSVDQKQIYFSLQTFVVGVDNTQYLWGAEALDKYVRIDAVSFDDGETWLTEFPVIIPENAGEFTIRAQYRLKETDDWTDRLVDYDPADTRVMVLSENVEGSISADQILNADDQNPALDSRVNLFRWQSDLMGQYPEKLFSGWTENGETVPFLYPVTAGRHVLQPGAYVDIPNGFTMENKVYWMNDNYEIDGDYSNLAYLQTVIGVEEDLVANFVATGMLTIPDYVQAVDLAPKETLEVEILRVPESVLYMSGVGLRVRYGYIVEESNPNYTCQDGLLLNKDRTAILAVPLAETEVTVPKTVKSVSILADNHIRVLRLEADSMEDMPEISKESLHHCTVVVQDDLLDACILENLDVFTQGTGNRVAAASDPATAYYVEQSALFTTTGDLVEVLPGSNQGLRFSDGIHTVKTGGAGRCAAHPDHCSFTGRPAHHVGKGQPVRSKEPSDHPLLYPGASSGRAATAAFFRCAGGRGGDHAACFQGRICLRMAGRGEQNRVDRRAGERDVFCRCGHGNGRLGGGRESNRHRCIC